MAGYGNNKKLSSTHLELAEYVFAHPKARVTYLAEKFSVARNTIYSIRGSKPFKEKIALWESQKAKVLVEKLGTEEARDELAANLGQNHIINLLKQLEPKKDEDGNFAPPVDLSEGEKKTMFEASKFSIEQVAKKQNPDSPSEPGGDIYINNMLVNMDNMPVDKVREILDKAISGEGV